MSFASGRARIDTLQFTLCLLAPWSLLWLDSSLLFPYATGKAWVFRSIVELAFALYIINRLTHSVIATPEVKIHRGRNLFLFLLIGFLVWTAMTNLGGADPFRSFWSNYERMSGMIAYLHWAMYFICLYSVLNTSRARLIGINLALIIFCVCALGLLDSEKRTISTLGNPIYLGNLAVFGLFITGFVLADYIRKRQSDWLKYVILGCILLVTVLVYALTLLGTASRGSFLALLVGLLAVAGVLVMKRLTRLSPKLALITCAVLFLIAWVTMADLPKIQSELAGSDHYALKRIARTSMQDQTTADRIENWKIAEQASREHPVIGWGQENYPIAFTEHYRAGVMDFAKIWFDRAHNAYLDALVASGYLGLVLYTLILIFPIALAWRIKTWPTIRKALFIGFLCAFLAKSVTGFDTFSSTLIWLTMTAVLVASDQTLRYRSRLPKLVTTVAFVSVISSAVISIYLLNFQPYIHNRELGALIKNDDLGKESIATASMTKVLNKAKYAPNTSLVVLDNILTKSFDSDSNEAHIPKRKELFQRTMQFIATELKRQPRDYRLKYNTALLLLKFKKLTLSIQLLEELTFSAPDRIVFWSLLAQAYQANGNQELARQAKDTMKILNPNWPK